MSPELVASLDRDMTSSELGYSVAQQLLATREPFTAIVAFNDISAIGAIRALKDFNLRVPEDVSVIGSDDIRAAGFTMPRLTTINQPLEEMGRVATRSYHSRIYRSCVGLKSLEFIARSATCQATA